MKRGIRIISWLMLLAALGFHTGCKKSEEVTTYTLTVKISAGVTGTPSEGTYTVKEGQKVSYHFELLSGYSNLIVLLDGDEVDASDTITIGDDHVLQAYVSGSGEFTLTTTVGTGVTGTPTAGTVTYKEGDVVSYNFAALAGYTDVVVELDGDEVDASGTITMSTNHELAVTASEKVNVVGSWTLTEAYTDDSSFTVTITFVGDLDSGTVTDSDGGSGVYTVTNNILAFNLDFPDVTYKYTVGTMDDDGTLSGSCNRYKTDTTYYSGSWTAVRVSSTSNGSPGRPATSRKPKGDDGK
jgi:hypothetical protein